MSTLSPALIEFILGPLNDLQLQNSPVLGDVWVAYAVKPSDAIDLLITPHMTAPAGPVARVIADRVRALKLKRVKSEESKVAYLQGLVAAKLFFEELLRIIVPLTQWWNESKIQDGLKPYLKGDHLRKKVQDMMSWAKAETDEDPAQPLEDFATFSALDRYISLAGIILWTATENKDKNLSLGAGEALTQLDSPDPIVERLREAFDTILSKPKPGAPKPQTLIWQVSLNRKALPALERSVPSVKGDAARTLFNVNCSKINWAVLDSGIDGNHPGLNGKDGKSRIVKAFDFSNIREIVSLDNTDTETKEFKERVKSLLAAPLQQRISAQTAKKNLKELADDAANDRHQLT